MGSRGAFPALAEVLSEHEDREAGGQGGGCGDEWSDHAAAPSRALIHVVTASRAEAPNVAGIVIPVG